MRKLLASTFGLALLASAGTASAQNADPFFFGDDAALASGAVVASGSDSGSLWYNPAGFAGLKRGLVSASASTFGIRFRKIPNALGYIVGGQTTTVDLPSTDIISVPNAVVAATNINEQWALAAGLLTTSRDLREAFAASPDKLGRLADGTPVILGQRIDLSTDASTYHAGAALAYKASDDLRLGFALFGTYEKLTNNVHYAFSGKSGAVPPTAENTFIVEDGRVTTSSIGVGGSIGAQYDVTKQVSVGLTLRTPEIALTASSDGGGAIASATTGGTDPPTSNITLAPAPAASGGIITAPARILGGISYALGPPRSFVELGVDFAHGLPKTSLADARQPQVNVRVGVRYGLSPGWTLGGGLFTDRATARDLSLSLGADRVDYYGLTLGFSKRTPLALVKDHNAEALVLVTTLSLRAAAGFGDARGLNLDLESTGAPANIRTSVTFWELMPYLGSSVLF